MPTSPLPPKDSPNLHLVVASDDELLAQQNANSSEWKGALSLDVYLRREDLLLKQELTKEGGLTPWMLAYQPEDGGKRQVLCGCESIRKEALVAHKGKVEAVVAHGVASVFCPESNRGRGYAGRMMTELAERLKGHQTGEHKSSLFSILFSDIGKEFYKLRGWHPFPSSHLAISPSNDETVARSLPATRPLKSEDLPELCARDAELIRARMEKQSKEDHTVVALVPDHRTLLWHHAREDFVAKELFDSHPTVKGCVVGEAGSRVWCYWTRVWTNPQEEAPDTLHILRLAIEDESFEDFAPATQDNARKVKESSTTKAIAALFAAARLEASKWKLNEVQIWNPTSTTLAAAQMLDADVQVVSREKESIASLQWYGEGSWEDVDWICNEKFGWC